MIRVSKHKISGITNNVKLEWLDRLFDDYRHDLLLYINYIIDGVLPLKVHLSSKLLPTEIIKHSKYKRDIYTQASQIVRSQIKKAEENRYKTYKQLYKYFKTNGKQTSFTSKKYKELQKKDILKTKYFTLPNIKNLTISLGAEFINFQDGNHFDNFMSIKLPYFNEKGTRGLKINIPFKHHRHSNKFKEKGYKQKDTISIRKVANVYYVSLIWEKDKPSTKTKETQTQTKNNTLGIDTGYRKLIVTSKCQILGNEMPRIYSQIVRVTRNSNHYKRLLKQRDNLVNQYCNQIDLNGITTVVVEDLKDVKKHSKYNNKVNDLLSRWTYKAVLTKIERICEVNGIGMVKVSPQYTSQTCSSCGSIHKENRQNDNFKCIECDYEIDADINAAINIRNKGVYSPLDLKSDFCVKTSC